MDTGKGKQEGDVVQKVFTGKGKELGDELQKVDTGKGKEEGDEVQKVDTKEVRQTILEVREKDMGVGTSEVPLNEVSVPKKLMMKDVRKEKEIGVSATEKDASVVIMNIHCWLFWCSVKMCKITKGWG